MKRFFAGESDRGSCTSYGFANDWTVYVFDNRDDRDCFVRNRDNLSCIAIPAHQATSRAANWSMTRNEYNKPKPFSGEFWAIGHMTEETTGIPGCIGVLFVGYDNDTRFYK